MPGDMLPHMLLQMRHRFGFSRTKHSFDSFYRCTSVCHKTSFWQSASAAAAQQCCVRQLGLDLFAFAYRRNTWPTKHRALHAHRTASAVKRLLCTFATLHHPIVESMPKTNISSVRRVLANRTASLDHSLPEINKFALGALSSAQWHGNGLDIRDRQGRQRPV